MKKLVMIVIAILMMAGGTMAQDEVLSGECEVALYQQLMAIMSETVLEAQTVIATSEDGMNAVFALITALESWQLQCGGGMLSSDTHPSGIVGPITFEGTLYQAELTSPGTYGFLQMTVISGDCGLIPPLVTTDISGGSETDLWTFGGDCVGMIEVNAPDGWTLTLSRWQ